MKQRDLSIKGMRYLCPVCGLQMTQMFGERMHPNNSDFGVTLYCPNLECSAQEVMGHGRTVVEALEVVQNRFPDVKKDIRCSCTKFAERYRCELPNGHNGPHIAQLLTGPGKVSWRISD
jgi:hypothetical protein